MQTRPLRHLFTAAEKVTGYRVGGISPFATNRKLHLVIEESSWPFPLGFRSMSSMSTEPTGHPEHGFTDTVHCPYVETNIRPQNALVKSWAEDRMREAQMVKVLIFQGEVKRVFCAHFRKSRDAYHPDSGACQSESHPHRGFWKGAGTVEPKCIVISPS